jgi:hypothetical protein
VCIRRNRSAVRCRYTMSSSHRCRPAVRQVSNGEPSIINHRKGRVLCGIFRQKRQKPVAALAASHAPTRPPFAPAWAWARAWACTVTPCPPPPQQSMLTARVRRASQLADNFQPDKTRHTCSYLSPDQGLPSRERNRQGGKKKRKEKCRCCLPLGFEQPQDCCALR